jgi:hypothetical protein
LAISLVGVRPYLSKLLPIIAVGAVLAFSLLVGNKISINPKLVACPGYGYGYGYQGGPMVASINPTMGPTDGGTLVTITGQGYCGSGPVTAVNFGATPAQSFSVISDTSISAVSPAHGQGPVDVTVVTTGGTSPINSGDVFTYEFGLYLTWYDLQSAGVNADTIHITNPNVGTVTAFLSIPNGPSMTVHVNSGQDGFFEFPSGTLGGPVQILTDKPVIATLRAWYYQSFNETPARRLSAAATTQYYPWYDLASAGTRADTIHITNESGQTATGTITLVPDLALGSTAPAPITVNVAPGLDAFYTFGAGAIGGPVKITTNVPVLSSLRAWFNQSFNETPAHPASSAAMTQYFNWYDLASTGVRADTIHITNVSGATASGTVSIVPLSGSVPTPLNFTVANGADTFMEFPSGTIGGPVTISSDHPVITALRAWYYLSFNEVPGRAAGDARATQYFPWYDLASAGTNADTIHITNVSGATAHGMITMGATGFMTFLIPSGTDQFFSFGAGQIGGPVTIESDVPVLASLRAWYYQSFNEVPGYS